MQKDKFSEGSELRRKAEKLIKKKESERKTQLSEVETLKLIHELEVHQIELEMQKDELEHYQEELEQSLLRYSGLYDFAPIGYFTLSEKGKIIEVNLTAATMLGRNRGELMGKEISHLIFPEDLDIFYFHRQKLFENHDQQVYEIRMRSSDGRLFWARMEASLTYDTDNNKACFVAMSNIIKQKESEEKYRLLVENSGIGVGLYSLDGKILYFNQKAVQNMGGNPEDFIGKPLKEVFGEQTASFYINRFQEVVKSNKSLEFEDFVELPSGNYWFLSNHTCIKNPDGTIFGVQVVAHDITERKLAEEKLKASEEVFRVLSLLSPVGIYVTDHQGNCQYTNQKWREMAGISEEDAMGNGWKKSLHPDDRELVFSNWKRMIDSKGSWGMDYRFLTPSGKISWVHGIASPQYDDFGNIISYIGVNIDITEQKEVENALKESEEKYKILVELSPDSIVVHSDGKIVYGNKAAVSTIGAKSMEEVIGLSTMSFVHPDSLDLAVERIKLMYTEKRKADLIREKFVRLDGQVIDVETTATYLLYGGKPSIQLIFRDITDRIRIEAEKQENEIKYKTIFECNNDALFLMDHEISIECNPKTLEIFGCSREQIIGQPPYRFSPEFQPDGSNSTDKAKEKIDLAFQGKEQVFEWQHCRYDGTLFDAEVRLNIIRIKDKDRLMASVRDITYRKIAEAELKKSESKYRLLADSITDMVWLMDFDLNLVYASPSVVKKSGFTIQELQQIPVEKKVTASSFKYLSERLAKEMLELNSDPQNYTPTPIDLEVVHKDGTFYWLEIIYNMIFGESGDPVSILCVGRDITAHKLLSEKLRDSEEKLNLFFSQSLDGFFFMMLDEPIVWDDSTDKEKELDYIFSHQRVTKVNKAMLDQYGATEEQFKGYTPADFFAHDIDQGRRVWKVFFDNGHLHIDTKEKKFDGTDMIIEGDYILLYDSEKRIIGEFGIQRDVTALRITEEKIKRQLDELQRWQLVTLGREDRNRELKREVNELLVRLGETIRYPSQENSSSGEKKDNIS
jgi:PAS domain S-box-containing protein